MAHDPTFCPISVGSFSITYLFPHSLSPLIRLSLRACHTCSRSFLSLPHLQEFLTVFRQGDYEECKISSSSMRSRLLGKRLRPTGRAWDRSTGPFIIGLTGGSSSGKSSVGRRLEALGAGLVDCDKLGMYVYIKTIINTNMPLGFYCTLSHFFNFFFASPFNCTICMQSNILHA